MRTSRLILAIVSAALVSGLVYAAARNVGGANPKDPGIDKLIADYTAAFNQGDAKALAKHYTDNAIRVSPGGGATLGRSAIEKHFADRFAADYNGAVAKLALGSVEMISDDVALIEGTYELTPKGADGKAAPPIKGRYLNTLVKKDGAWLIAGNAAVLPEPPTR